MDTSRPPIRILIVDDHPVVRQGLRSLLSNHADLQIIAEAGHAQEAFAAVKQDTPDIVLLDIRLPGMTGIEAARQIHRDYPQIRIIMLTSYDDDEYLVGPLSGHLSDRYGAPLRRISRRQPDGAHAAAGSARSSLAGGRAAVPAAHCRIRRGLSPARAR